MSKPRFEQVQLEKPVRRLANIKSVLGAWVWSSGDLVSLETNLVARGLQMDGEP